MDIVNFVFLYLDIYCKQLLLYVLINLVLLNYVLYKYIWYKLCDVQLHVFNYSFIDYMLILLYMMLICRKLHIKNVTWLILLFFYIASVKNMIFHDT